MLVVELEFSLTQWLSLDGFSQLTKTALELERRYSVCYNPHRDLKFERSILFSLIPLLGCSG